MINENALESISLVIPEIKICPQGKEILKPCKEFWHDILQLISCYPLYSFIESQFHDHF